MLIKEQLFGSAVVIYLLAFVETLLYPVNTAAPLLVFFSSFKVIVFSMLNENFFVTCKVKR